MSPKSSRSRDQERPRTRDPVVLVVDDEAEVQRAMRRVLEFAGYSVLTVESSFHARDLLHSVDEIDCICTDQRMPGPAGLSLIDFCRNHRPSIGRVMYVAEMDGTLAILPSGWCWVVQKPAPPRVLVDRIERAMRGDYP